MTIEDDFGFTNLQLAYEIQRPSYIKEEPLISMFNIPLEDMTKPQQDIQTIWNLDPLGLMPEDEVHFHFELSDNDIISGPKTTISTTFIARVPSLADLYESAEQNESKFVDDLADSMDEFQKL